MVTQVIRLFCRLLVWFTVFGIRMLEICSDTTTLLILLRFMQNRKIMAIATKQQQTEISNDIFIFKNCNIPMSAMFCLFLVHTIDLPPTEVKQTTLPQTFSSN